MYDRTMRVFVFIFIVLASYGIYRLSKFIGRERFRRYVMGTSIGYNRVNIFRYSAYRFVALRNRKKLVKEMCDFINAHGGAEYIYVGSPFSCVYTYDKTSNTNQMYIFKEHGYEDPIPFDAVDIFQMLAKKLHCKYKATRRTETSWSGSDSTYISGGTTTTGSSSSVSTILECIEIFSPQRWTAYQNDLKAKRQEQKKKDNFYKKI